MSRLQDASAPTPGARLLTYLGAALSVLLLASGCGSSPPDTTPEKSPQAADGPMYAAPKVGACRNIDLKDTKKTSVEEFVPCGGTYTSKVVDVSELPANLSATSDADAVYAHQLKVCPKPARKAVGGITVVRRTSLFLTLGLVPSPAQAKKGARWFSCDVYAADDEELILLPKKTPFLVKADDDPLSIKRYAQCLADGATPNVSVLVSCTKKHFAQPGTAIAFPTEKAAARESGYDSCARRFPNDPTAIVGSTEPHHSELDDRGVPWIRTCFIFDSKYD